MSTKKLPLFSGRYWALCQSNGSDRNLHPILLHLDSRWWERRVWKLWSWLWNCPPQLPWGGLRMSYQLSWLHLLILGEEILSSSVKGHLWTLASSDHQSFGKIPGAFKRGKKLIWKTKPSLSWDVQLFSPHFHILTWYFFYLFIFNWRMITLQNFVVFCQTSTLISHRCTYVTSLLNLLPISPFPTYLFFGFPVWHVRY